MSISAMTLSRDTTPAAIERGWRMRSWSTPSMRNRMRRSCSVGSTWMSDARSCTAWRITRFTNLTIGASSTIERRPARSACCSIDVVGHDLGDRQHLLFEARRLGEHVGQLLLADPARG